VEEQTTASNEIAAHIEKVAQLTGENSRAAEQTAGQAGQLAQLADDMTTTVNRFKI
jgi:methyl-accepting chemotaxis protein